VLKPLRSEGLTDIELVGVFTNGKSWGDHNPEFDGVTFPMLLDPEGGVFYLYGTSSYEVIFVDKKQRLVSKQIFDDSLTLQYLQKARELHDE
jgi:hypothetical protein